MVIYRAIGIVLNVIEVAILIRAFISWLPFSKESKLVYLLFQITEPILAPIRNLVQRSSFGKNIMFDISPIIAFILLRILRIIVFDIFL